MASAQHMRNGGYGALTRQCTVTEPPCINELMDKGQRLRAGMVCAVGELLGMRENDIGIHHLEPVAWIRAIDED